MRSILLSILTAVLLIGCVDDAPHDNPLDPESPGYSVQGSLTGVVRIAGQTTAVAGAAVLDTDAGVSVTTDSLGHFRFNDVAAGTHRFVCTKEHFTPDTFLVEIPDRASVHVVRGMNAAPVTVSRSILTRKIDQYFPSPQYYVEIAAAVTDPNSITDLDSVWFGVDTIRYPLGYSVPDTRFIGTIYKYQLPTNTIQWLVGRALTIVARDKQGAVSVSEPFFVTRVIEQTAVPIASNTDSLASGFDLKWSPPDVTFTYTYTVALSRVDGGVATLIRTYPGIDSFNEKLSYPADAADVPLAQGAYVWSVTVVDEFGNSARSKESSFTVK